MTDFVISEENSKGQVMLKNESKPVADIVRLKESDLYLKAFSLCTASTINCVM